MSSNARNDFHWVEDAEPHHKRRIEILEKHPEVKTLFGVDPSIKYITVLLVAIQVAATISAQHLSWLPFLLMTYFIGGTISQSLFLAIHEITHNLAFKNKKYNNMLAIFANLGVILPYAISFKIYHSMHHWEQGKDGVDTDIPLVGEARLFRGFFGKLIWFFSQIAFYGFRPIMVKPIKLEKWQVINIIVQVIGMSIILYFAGWYGVLYLVLSLLVSGSIHPTAGHFISEHYVFHEGQETYSYYGPLNALVFNAGYHNEHHDFPTIPGSRLPKLKKMAPEYYDNLHSYKSWTMVILRFLFQGNINLFSRTKRK